MAWAIDPMRACDWSGAPGRGGAAPGAARDARRDDDEYGDGGYTASHPLSAFSRPGGIQRTHSQGLVKAGALRCVSL